MVVDNLDILSSGLSPTKADAPLLVDPDRMLAKPVALQRLQMIAGRGSQIVQSSGMFYGPEPPLCPGIEIWRKTLGRLAGGDRFNSLALE